MLDDGSLRIDLMLCDVHMPGIGGLETARRLQQNGHLFPLLAMTVRAWLQLRLRARSILAFALAGRLYLGDEVRVQRKRHGRSHVRPNRPPCSGAHTSLI
jgi:CheY-like chemotaxis protein